MVREQRSSVSLWLLTLEPSHRTFEPSHWTFALRTIVPSNRSSEVQLRAELHEPPVEHLRRLPPSGIVGTEKRDRRVAVEEIVGIHIELEPRRPDLHDLGAAQVELIDARPEDRERLRERN